LVPGIGYSNELVKNKLIYTAVKSEKLNFRKLRCCPWAKNPKAAMVKYLLGHGD